MCWLIEDVLAHGVVLNYWRYVVSLEMCYLIGDVLAHWRCVELLEMCWLIGDVMAH